MFSAYLFDLDGTLADTERQNAASVEAALEAHGRALTDEERDYIVGHGWKDIYVLLEKNRPTGFTYDQLKEAAAKMKNDMVRRQGLTVCPGAIELLVRLAEGPSRARLAVVTGSSRIEAEFVLAQMGVRSRFAEVIPAEDVSAGKPSPEGYLLAASRLGIAPEMCVVFEDSAAGIESARRAGMACIAVSIFDFAGHDQRAAGRIVQTLADVTDELLEELFRSTDLARRLPHAQVPPPAPGKGGNV